LAKLGTGEFLISVAVNRLSKYLYPGKNEYFLLLTINREYPIIGSRRERKFEENGAATTCCAISLYTRINRLTFRPSFFFGVKKNFVRIKVKFHTYS